MTIPGKLLLFASTTLLACAAHAADTAKYQGPRNEYGQPDLRGVWNYSSDVPLQRPKDTPDKLFRTREEIEKANAARAKQLEQLTQQGVGFHNDFWLDFQSQVNDLPTSLLVYPASGRVPKLADQVPPIAGLAAAFKHIPGTRPVRFRFGGTDKAGQEDPDLSERCLMSHIGPPLTPGFDNNYLQILQGR